MEVFFDDFSVDLMATDIVQKDDYYPFGGSFNAYTDLSTPQQDYLYNGVRLNKTTQLYETAFRTYDPYLGRFNHIDPLTAIVPGLSPYHFGFNNPARYSDPLGLMGDDAGMWGTGNTYASTHSQNPFDLMPKFTRTNPGSGNHWSDGISGNPNDQAKRDYYILSGSEFEKKYGAHQANTVFIAGNLYLVSNTTKWIEYDGVANEKSYTYETTFTKAAQNGGYENQYGTRPRNVEDFVDRFDGMTYDEIMLGNSSFLGIKYPNRLADARYGFVRDPHSPGTGRQVDMIHFMVVGQKGVMMGLANELQQLGQGIFGNDHAMESAFHPQDLYSNRLGAEFFQSYGALIEQNPTKIAQYIGQFLNDPGRNRYKIILK